MRFSLAVFGLIFVALGAQCSWHTPSSQSPATPRHPLLGRYVLAGYDDSGRMIFTGEVELLSIEQNRVKGQCKLKKEKDAPQALYDISSNCEGLIDGKKLDLDLAPELYDAGVRLKGEITGGRIKGEALFDSYGPSLRFGHFEAVKSALGSHKFFQRELTI